jgi:hypothetical protein
MNNSHLPNRRLLGDWRSEAFTLNSAEVSGFLSRHPDIKAKVQLFQQEVVNYGYQQGVSMNYAIPEWGIAVPDSEFRNVAIFPDAAGQLVFTGNIPDDISLQVNKPPYISPSGNNPDPLGEILAAIPWIVGGLIGLSFLQTFRNSK